MSLFKGSKEFICKYCNKGYKTSQSRSNHYRKFHDTMSTQMSFFVNNLSTQCKHNVPTNENMKKLTCNFCNKLFTTRQSKSRHQNQYCHQKNKNENINNEKEIKIIHNEINYNIIINNFNNDNLEYISDGFRNKIFQHLKFDDEFYLPIPKLIENIKFNHNHKENNNVKITNLRSPTGLKYDNNEWIIVDKEDLLNELFQSGFKTFNKFYKEKYNKSPDDNFIQSVKYELKNEIKKKIERIAYIYTKNIDLDI